MKKKVVGFIVCTLLITAAAFSVVGTDKNRNSLNEKYTRSNLERSVPLNGLFEWPMFRHDLNNTGYSPSLAPDDNTVLWSKYIGDWVDSNPTLKDERLYIVGDNYGGAGGADLWCLNPFTGDEIWKTDLPGEFVWGSPTVGTDRVYVLGTYFNLYCLDAYNGDILWMVQAFGHCSPMEFNNKVYFGNYGDGFYCLNASNGEEIWVHDPLTDYQGCTPAIANGKVYIGSHPYGGDGTLYCLDADTGNEIWNYSTTGWGIWSAPSVVNNKVYFATDHLYCLDASTGDEVWAEPGIVTSASPAVAYGNVYIGNGVIDGKFYCFDADDGDLIWDSQSLGTGVPGGAAVADGKVYFNSYSNPARFNCLDAYTGDIIWQFNFIVTGGIWSSPAVAYGNAYVGAGEDGYIYAFGTPNEPPETPSKPDGHSEGIVGVEYIFNTSTTDPEGDDIYYLFDWGDGTNSDWQGPYASGAIVDASHMWTEIGDYEIRAKAHDGRRESNWSEALILIITIENDPPDAPSITGKTNGKAGVGYEYTFNAVDPDDHDVKYFIDWGDGNTEWTGFSASGTPVTESHTWAKGTYIITAYAQDEYGLEGPEGTLEVTMPRNKVFNFNFPMLGWLFERFPNAFPILRHMLGH